MSAEDADESDSIFNDCLSNFSIFEIDAKEACFYDCGSDFGNDLTCDESDSDPDAVINFRSSLAPWVVEVPQIHVDRLLRIFRSFPGSTECDFPLTCLTLLQKVTRIPL